MCVWSLFGWHTAVESNESQCVWPQCIAGWVRDWGKVEITWSTVWKRLTGQQEGGQALAAECIWMPAETLSNGKDLARCQGTGVTLCLSGSVCVYVWMYVFEWLGGRQWYITQQKASSLLHLFGAQIRPRAHTHTHPHTYIHTQVLTYHSPLATCFADTLENSLYILHGNNALCCPWKAGAV